MESLWTSTPQSRRGPHTQATNRRTPPPPAVLPTADGFGYWRVGYDSTAGLGPSAPTRDQIDARIDEVAVWQDLSAHSDGSV